MWCWYSWRRKCQTVSLVIRGSDEACTRCLRNEPALLPSNTANAWKCFGGKMIDKQGKWSMNEANSSDSDKCMSRLVVQLTSGTFHFSSTSPIWKARFRQPLIFQFRFWHHIFVHQFRFQHPNYLLKFSFQTHTVLTVHATVQYSNTPSFANREIPTSQIPVSNTTPELKIPNSKREVSNITKLCLHREGGAKKRNIFTLMLFVFRYRSFTLVNVAHCRSL